MTTTDDHHASPVFVDAIYLRRPRITMMEGGGNRDIGNEYDVAPIFLNPFIPGDISLDMTHDSFLMRVDKWTWNLLQSNHERMGWWVWFTTMLWRLPLLLVLVFSLISGWIDLLLLLVSLGFFMVGHCSREYRRHRACQETARLVTESIRQQKGTVDWVVEFHTSDVPGRDIDRKYCERYVFST